MGSRMIPVNGCSDLKFFFETIYQGAPHNGQSKI
jgi:hypothetical protein